MFYKLYAAPKVLNTMAHRTTKLLRTANAYLIWILFSLDMDFEQKVIQGRENAQHHYATILFITASENKLLQNVPASAVYSFSIIVIYICDKYALYEKALLRQHILQMIRMYFLTDDRGFANCPPRIEWWMKAVIEDAAFRVILEYCLPVILHSCLPLQRLIMMIIYFHEYHHETLSSL